MSPLQQELGKRQGFESLEQEAVLILFAPGIGCAPVFAGSPTSG